MSTEILRRAANLMRERAEAATAGPWETYTNMHAEVFVSEIGRRGFGVISNPATGREDYGKANAEHIASWHPAVALAVADWLMRVVDWDERGYRGEDWTDALTVARAYLGDVS